MATQKRRARRTSVTPLTGREQAFVDEYLLSANGAKAAQAAGYARASAKVRASRLLRQPNVVAAVGEAKRLRAARVGVSQDRVLSELEQLAFSRIDNYVIDPVTGLVAPRDGVSGDVMRAIAAIKHRSIPTPEGTIHEVEVRLWDKPSMLRLAGRHVGVKGFTNRLELTGDDGQPVGVVCRIDSMSDEELKARVETLIAKI